MAPFMPLGPGVSTISAPKASSSHAALEAHGLGHGEDELVALDRGDKGQGDAGVAAGRLDEDGLAGRDFAGLLGGIDHGEADAVLDARYGVLAFQLGDDGCRASPRPRGSAAPGGCGQ